MSVFFVTGAGTDIGKTYVACALLRAWREAGVACDALKPVLSGYDDAEPALSDPARLLEALGKDVTPAAIDRIAPLRFRAPVAPPLAARAEGLEIDLDAVTALCRTRAAVAEGVLLIEGAGGVMSPVTMTATNLDLIRMIDAPVVFVAGSYLGAVSHALTGLDALATRGVAVATVIVSESAESVGLQETRDMIQSQRRAYAVFAAVREEASEPPEWARVLAARLVQ
jgi:dethiobiotin synthetase